MVSIVYIASIVGGDLCRSDRGMVHSVHPVCVYSQIE